jgi:DNA-binding NarL/FixJ family response regulator
MDIRLPDESGLELTKKIKANWPDTTIIILTHYDFPEYREAAAKYGVNHFLAKGSTCEEEILRTVQSILSQRNIDLNGHHPNELS